MPSRNVTSNKPSWTREEENALAEWLTIQRLLFECGKLEPWKAKELTAKLGPWYHEASERELNHAFFSDNADLNDALTIWFNHHKLAPEPLTFAEIQEYAEAEMGLKR